MESSLFYYDDYYYGSFFLSACMWALLPQKCLVYREVGSFLLALMFDLPCFLIMQSAQGCEDTPKWLSSYVISLLITSLYLIWGCFKTEIKCRNTSALWFRCMLKNAIWSKLIQSLPLKSLKVLWHTLLLMYTQAYNFPKLLMANLGGHLRAHWPHSCCSEKQHKGMLQVEKKHSRYESGDPVSLSSEKHTCTSYNV